MENKQFGSCRVVELIASGHVTDVYRAVQQPLGREVAVKTLKPSIVPSSPFAGALQREAQILASLRHENIARLLDHGINDQSMWIVIELVDGFTLRHLLSHVKDFDVPTSVALVLQVARALAHAHDLGVIHCDVRPSNILVAKGGSVMLVDFGSAHVENMPAAPEPLDIDASLSLPSYMSPEQILGEPLDPRSDVFALGVVLYELLAGRQPFEGKDERTLAHSVRHDEPPPMDRAAVPRALIQVVARCLQKLPGDRFASAQELCTALEGVYGNATTAPRRQVISATLARARLIDRPVRVEEDRSELLGQVNHPPSIVPALRMLLIMLALLAVGGVVIHVVFRTDIEARASSGQGALPLVPDRAGSLLVLAQPWAHVIIDGQKVETTPFARPIPLSAGVHHVTLRHPLAPDERRTIHVASGERVVLDVTMQVRRPPKPDASAPAPVPTSSTP